MAKPTIWCRIFGCDEVTVAAGYPPYSMVWHSYKECTRCGQRVDERDDLFAPPRPDDFPMEKNYVIRSKGGGR